jgi:hypothetical protein
MSSISLQAAPVSSIPVKALAAGIARVVDSSDWKRENLTPGVEFIERPGRPGSRRGR